MRRVRAQERPPAAGSIGYFRRCSEPRSSSSQRRWYVGIEVASVSTGARSRDEEQPICSTQSEPWWRRSPQYEKLMAKKHDLGFAIGMRSEQRPPSSLKTSIIPTKLPHRCVCANQDEIFGRHNAKARKDYVVDLSNRKVERSLKSLAARSRRRYSTAGRKSVSRRASIHFGLHQPQ
jgi:hypothetical protein